MFYFVVWITYWACGVLLCSCERFGQKPESVVGRLVDFIVMKRAGHGSMVMEDECSSSFLENPSMILPSFIGGGF